MLIASSYTKKIKTQKNEFFLYHSLFNNPLLVEESISELLDFLKTPKDQSAIISKFGDESPSVIKLLQDNFLIISPDFNERAKLREIQQNFLNELTTGSMLCRLELAISDACNLGCEHCMHFNNNQITNRHSKKLFMSFETARKCIDEFCQNAKRNDLKKIRIHFGNAEPFLNWSVMKECLEYCNSINKLQFSYAVNTNLTILTEEIITYLKRYNVKISTSLDGLREGNNKIRIYPNGQGTFRDILHNINRLKSAEFPIDGFGVTLTSKNFAYINNKLIDFAKELDISDISLDVDLANYDHLDIESIVDKIIQLRNYAKKLNINFYGTWETPYRIMLTGSWLKGIHSFCPAMEGKTLHYGNDGSLKICGHTNTIIGTEQNLKDCISKESPYYNMVKSRLPGNNEMCINCEIEGACAGQCHVTRESAQRNNNILTKLCLLLKETTKRLIINDYSEKK